MSPIFQNRDVPCGNRCDISAFGKGCGKAFAPGVIGSRFGRQAFGLESGVHLFGRNHFCLFGLLVVNRVGQDFAVVQEGEFLLGINTDGDLSVAQSIAWAVGLDLVDGLVELEGQVFGEGASFLPGQDLSEIFFGSERAMGIDGTSRFDRKALVEVGQEFRQIGIALRPIGNAPQA